MASTQGTCRVPQPPAGTAREGRIPARGGRVPTGRLGRRLPSLGAAATLALAAVLLGACSPTTGSGGSQTASGTPGGTGGPAAASSGAGRPPVLAAVTTAGALVLLDPATGRVTRSVVPSGVLGDALAVSPDGKTIYYEVGTGCQHEIWQVRTADGARTRISAAGNAPALSPDGTRLAYATQYFIVPDGDCYPDNATAGYQVVIVDLADHRSRKYPMPPQLAASGLPAPVSHLSWSPDGTRLAVSISAVQDNEGWRLAIMNPATDTSYFQDDESTEVALPGASPRAYYAEGVYLSDGHLFVARQCCDGYPPNTTNVDMLEIDPANGRQIRQISVGLTDRSHSSLDASLDGHWLLYLSGKDLEVARDGAKPSVLASGFLAAAW